MVLQEIRYFFFFRDSDVFVIIKKQLQSGAVEKKKC